MKTIGLIGGMSWESTAHYYREINELVKQRLGGLHSAQMLLYSVDFHDIELLQRSGDWQAAGVLLAQIAQQLETAGADCIVLATNTMHCVADAIEGSTEIPLLHIADPTAEAIKRSGVHTVGLLGTRFTMEQDFYRGRLETKHGLKVLVPGESEREFVHRVIYDELCRGNVSAVSRERYRAVIARLAADGAQAIIFGCTEIGMLLTQGDSAVPVFDTTALHAAAAVEFALAG